VVILAIVEQEAHHGYEISKLIELRTGGSLTFTLASLYATLYRLEERGWIRGRWVEKAGQRRRCYYRITEAGRKVLSAQREDWGRFITALGQVAGVKFA
jgi:DNA-binding PadR family transcriptional regulator